MSYSVAYLVGSAGAQHAWACFHVQTDLLTVFCTIHWRQGAISLRPSNVIEQSFDSGQLQNALTQGLFIDLLFPFKKCGAYSAPLWWF